MPLISGAITEDGAVIDVVVSVSRPRKRLLAKHDFRIPFPVHVRALIDTGASVSGFSPRVFGDLEISPVGNVPIFTPSTRPDAPHHCDLFDVCLSLAGGGELETFPDSRVLIADCWSPGEGIEALLGRDILDRCFFQYSGIDQTFTLAY